MVRFVGKLASAFRNNRWKFAIKVMAIAVCAIVIVSLFYFLTRPPYPSEKTSLSFIGNGIRWDNGGEISTNNHSAVHVAISTEEGSAGATWNFSLRNFTNVATYVDYDLGSQGFGNLSLSLNLIDFHGNGLFDRGDYLTLTLPPMQSFSSDTVYIVRIGYVASFSSYYSHELYFAFHDEVFYTWDPRISHYIM